MTPAHLLAAILALWGRSLTGHDRGALERRAGLVVTSARAHDVPLHVLAAVCWHESRMGTARAYASLCGVRMRGAYVSDDAVSAEVAARTLRAMLSRCHGTRAALAAYRTDGRCGDPRGAAYAGMVLATAERVAGALAEAEEHLAPSD
ncbi:MAG TPA: hypothetical protein VFV33_26155, partial [Gemmatimonadaceae bacterium]|nr:hypothetical protein [Gemmatimonadaceae bacterium]